MHNVVVSRVKPQLIRKRTIIRTPPTVKIIAKSTNQTKVIELQQLKRQRQTTRQSPPPQIRQPPAGIAVSRRNVRKTKKGKGRTTYKFRETTPESLTKILGLKGKGRHKILVIVGNGPSISEISLEKLKNIDKVDILSINKPDNRL